MSYTSLAPPVTLPDPLEKRYAQLEAGGAFHVNAPSQWRTDNHDVLGDQVPLLDLAAVHARMQDPSGVHAEPFIRQAYETDPVLDDRVFTGTYVDPETNVEYYAWENPIGEKEVDYSLNPDDDTLDRLREQFMGGTNDDVRAKLGVPDYKPEDNIATPMLNPTNGFRADVGEWDAVRLRTEEHARSEALRKMENNFEGVDERVGGPHGHIGYQRIHHARLQDVQGVFRAEDLDHKERANAPKSHTEVQAIRTGPTLHTRQEAAMPWRSHGTYGHTFGFREINQFPGDAQARSTHPHFIDNPRNVVLM